MVIPPDSSARDLHPLHKSVGQRGIDEELGRGTATPCGAERAVLHTGQSHVGTKVNVLPISYQRSEER